MCNSYHGPTIGIGYTFDFKTFYQLENAFLPYNRNGVLFPRKIRDKYAMLSRPSDTGHTPFGDIFYSMIYHGVINTCNGFVYRRGCALLDINEPWKVLARSRNYILSPETIYECVGDVPNVTSPYAALTDAATGRIAIYYGCADTVTGMAFSTVDELLAHMDAYPLASEV